MVTSKSYLTVVFCRGVVILLCLNLATGCTTLRPLPTGEPQAIREQISQGDTVRVTTRDGTQQEITVKETTTEQLIGESNKINLSDITSIEKREFSFLKTGGLAASIVVVVIVGMILIFVATAPAAIMSGG